MALLILAFSIVHLPVLIAWLGLNAFLSLFTSFAGGLRQGRTMDDLTKSISAAAGMAMVLFIIAGGGAFKPVLLGQPGLFRAYSAASTGPASDTAVPDAIKTLGAGRVCFGSDTPFARVHVCVAMYDAPAEGEITAAQKAGIMGGNLLSPCNVAE